MANKIQIRRDTTANWGVSDPILSQGELGLDTTLNKMKIGDGVSHWSELSFFIGNTGATGATGATGLQGPAGVTQLSNLTNSSVSLSLNATGSLTFPTLSVDIHNGGVQSAQVLKFDDATKQVIITGPTPAAGNSAERIIIQGQRATGTGEGGDVYLWGGDSAINGGDIKIYAGDADSDVSGAVGGYVNIDAGNGFTNGGNLTLSAGVARDGYGGNVNITAGYAYNGTPGNIQLNTYAQADSANLAWTFTNDGKLQLPEGGDIVNNAGNSITDIYKFEGGTIGTKNNAPTSNGWGGYNMYLDPGGESWASIFIPSVANQDSGTALQITNKGAATSIVQVIGWGGIQLVTNTGVDENVFEFNDNGSLSFPKGSNVSETSNTVAIAPPTAAAGQSLVIRPTTVAWGLAASGYIVYGSPITVSVTTIGGSSYFGTVNYTFSGCTAEQLGRALTGQITFPGGNTGNPQTITWTIPANSNITTFTLTLGSAVGVFGTDFNFELNGLPDGQFVTVTNNGITNSEFSHVHLVAGDPATVDIYLGDDDQYVKIEKNAGDVVIGTNLDTHQWTFGTDGTTTFPNNSIKNSLDSNTAITTQGTLTANNSYTNVTDFSTDVDLGEGIGVIAGWYQRNLTQIEFSLFGDSTFQSYLTGLALGRTVIVTYNTSGGTTTLTRTLTQAFSGTGQTDPNNPTWSRVSGRIDATLPVDQLGIVSINFPVYSTSTNDWTFGADGNLTLPGGIVKLEVDDANPSGGLVVSVDAGVPGYTSLYKFGRDGQFTSRAISLTNSSGVPVGTIVGDGLGPIIGAGAGKEVWVSSDGQHLWRFTADRSFVLPAAGGNIRSEGNINIDVNLTDSTLRRWQFGEDGKLALPDNGKIASGADTAQVGSSLTIANDGSGGLVGWGPNSLSVASNSEILSETYIAAGSTITFQDGVVATITQIDNYPEYHDIFWDTPKTGTLFPITLKTANYVAAVIAPQWTFGTDNTLTFPDGTTATGKSITVPSADSLTVNFSVTTGPLTTNTTFKANPGSIKLPTGNGYIYSGSETNADRWGLDSANKELSFPNGDSIHYGQGGAGLRLYTYTDPIKITVGQTTTWEFGSTGIQFPDASVQTTAYTGTGAVTFTGNQIEGNTFGGTGTIITKTVDNTGNNYSTGSGSLGFLNFGADGNIQNVKAGWTVTFASGVTRTVSQDAYQPLGTYWNIGFNSAYIWSAGNVMPVTFSSPDYVAGSDPKVTLTAGTESWTFDETGALTLPDDSSMITSTSLTVSTNYQPQLGPYTGAVSQSMTGNGYIVVGNILSDIFAGVNLNSLIGSTLVVAGQNNTVLGVTYLGFGNSQEEYSVQISGPAASATAGTGVAISITKAETKNNWVFGATGRTTFPNGTVPEHSYGAVGDKAGMLVVDATYIYYCTANYNAATPAADIWKRTAHGTGTW